MMPADKIPDGIKPCAPIYCGEDDRDWFAEMAYEGGWVFTNPPAPPMLTEEERKRKLFQEGLSPDGKELKLRTFFNYDTFQGGTQVTHLQLEASIDDEELRKLLSIGNKLESLKLLNCYEVTDRGLRHFTQNMPCLKSLTLDIGKQRIANLAIFGRISELQCLELSCGGIDLTTLPKFKKLRSLRLHFVQPAAVQNQTFQMLCKKYPQIHLKLNEHFEVNRGFSVGERAAVGEEAKISQESPRNEGSGPALIFRGVEQKPLLPSVPTKSASPEGLPQAKSDDDESTNKKRTTGSSWKDCCCGKNLSVKFQKIWQSNR